MKIKDVGGEFGLIKRVTRKIKDKKVLVEIGDDVSVIKAKNKYVLFTTDMLVENDHFTLKWFSPEQIGKKAIEVNVSDIASTGGIPKYALISLCLKKDTKVKFVDKLYKGMYATAKKHNLKIVGGDMTHGSLLVINVAMMGETDKKHLTLRSGAKKGDLIMVSGALGDSTAGLQLLKRGVKKHPAIKRHLNPAAQLKKSRTIAKYANAMIDVSDGLASEIRHICDLSKKGAIIYKEKIPISKAVKNTAKKSNKNPYNFVNGGEDFQLIFTINKKHKGKFKECFVIGKILDKKQGIFLLDKGKKKKLGKGYEHF